MHIKQNKTFDWFLTYKSLFNFAFIYFEEDDLRNIWAQHFNFKKIIYMWLVHDNFLMSTDQYPLRLGMHKWTFNCHVPFFTQQQMKPL